ncbi:unnamed protein product [Allacma fusca]|nr:unnamed protein product [Allacma fusca]
MSVLKSQLHVIAGLWLLLSLVLNNSYKSVVESSLSIFYPVTTKWKSLAELSNFSLYVAIDSCARYAPTQLLFGVEDNATLDENYRHVCDQRDLVEKMDTNCKFWSAVNDLGHLRSSSVLASVLKGMKNSTWYFCTRNLKQIMRMYLMKPRSAFVTSTEKFEKFWRVFKVAMKTNYSSFKFASNSKFHDKSLNFDSGYFFSTLDAFHHHVVPNRLKILLSSGIYNLWTKWNERRDESKNAQDSGSIAGDESQQAEASFEPLSYSNSDLYLIFNLKFISLGISGLIFLFENFSHFYKCHIKNAMKYDFYDTKAY